MLGYNPNENIEEFKEQLLGIVDMIDIFLHYPQICLHTWTVLLDRFQISLYICYLIP